MKSKELRNKILFIVVLITVVVYRCFVLFYFGFEHTDSDQTIMWQGLQDYSNGVFHEPRFYGQAYNSMLEALFAIPLYKLGVPPYKALPVITSFFTLLPFVGIAFYSYLKKNIFIAITILSLPLLMTMDYDMMTSLSRGFVPGIFLSSLGLLAILYNLPKKHLLFCFFGVLGFSANPNSVILTFPIALYVLWENKTQISFYINSFLGLAAGGLIHFWVNSFYVNNPKYNIHSYNLEFSFSDMAKGVSNLDGFFNQVSPVLWINSFFFLLVFFILGVFLFIKKRNSLGIFFISSLVVIVISLGINKVYDGYNSIFFSRSRMFLAFPVVIAFGLTFVKDIRFRHQYFLLLIPFSFLAYKVYSFEDKVIENTAPKSDHVIGIKTVEDLKLKCNELNLLSKKHNVDLIVIVNSYEHDFINYGCAVCEDDFPKTLRPSFERRTWRLIEDETLVYKTVLILDFKKKYENLLEIDYKTFLVVENDLKTIDLLKKLEIDYREY